MTLRSAAIVFLVGSLIAPACVPLLAQQAPVQAAGAPTTTAVGSAIQGAANSTNATVPTFAPALPNGIPQVPQITAPALSRGAAGGAAGSANAARPANPGRQPAGPASARAVSAPAVTAPVAENAGADAMLTKLAPQMDLRVGGKDAGGLRLSGTVGIVVMMGLLTLLPTLVLLMTGFTRILIVLNFLRQALGTQNAPPAQLVAALSLILTGFVMAPTLTKVNETALQPWMNGTMDQAVMMKTAVVPFRDFMLKHTRDHDLQVFIDMSPGIAPQNEDQIPLVTLVSAFATSELRTAFQIGFALFLPFIIIDIVVSSVLMSMGMFMLPPAMISLPFKLLLFVLVDGWTLVVQSLVISFRV
ncbi:MAG: flagellar type III secretion system pore protein FliP [Gemmatimonadaceae bacterium]